MELHTSEQQQRVPQNGELKHASIPALLSGLVHEGQHLIRAELEVAKADLRREAKVVGKGAGIAGAGGAVLYVSLFCFAATLIALLDRAMPLWLSALLVTAMFAIAGIVLVQRGRKEFKHVTPRATMQELKEDSRWIQQIARDVKVKRHASA